MRLPHYDDFRKELHQIIKDDGCNVMSYSEEYIADMAWQAFGRLIVRLNEESVDRGHNFKRDPEAGGC